MFSKAISFGSLAILAGIALLVMTPMASVYAQESNPTPESGCVSCHENLYLLHDTGKSFCLCAEEMSCTCCHAGNPDTLIADQAHSGMVANPILAEGAICQECHTANTQAHIEKFATVAGIKSFLSTPQSPTPIPAEAFQLPVETGPTFILPLRVLEPWRLALLGVLGIALAGIVFFGYQCWRTDCRLKNRPQ